MALGAGSEKAKWRFFHEVDRPEKPRHDLSGTDILTSD